MTNRVIVGALGGSFGVHGEVRLKSFCADPQAIADYTPLFTEDGRCFAQVILTGHLKNGFTARLDGVVTKEDADALRNIDLYADRSRLPSLPDDEYYYSDLIGLTVLDTGGATLGTVKNVMDHGAGDLLEIQVKGHSETVLLPFTQEIVPTVDLSVGKIIVNPPEGSLPN
ncbi:ribosome maturation factor RimM [Yoonia sediminilitoris]|uniref:Ribosome maturation factor RimM n=1 Tax=Yoonia sediminilitoris TaxID=1286148 RepID=A0A2T6K874_9RHOB|nr:ribosome maturation factor RimM [Yoonia sediminilitoris]PUB10885.1 16S rRNA processing protein RimM [Yoonia sediminilitoris]RCW90560.1 16S rRNA processing protein RimM [Yoonia sediminilitoris]